MGSRLIKADTEYVKVYDAMGECFERIVNAGMVEMSAVLFAGVVGLHVESEEQLQNLSAFDTVRGEI